MLNSARRNISYPNPDRSDRPDIPAHIKNLVDALELDVVFVQDTQANRLAAAHQSGLIWRETDTGTFWWDTGAVWVALGPDMAFATTVAGLGTANDNKLGFVELANGTVVPLKYDAGIGKWVSPDQAHYGTCDLYGGTTGSWFIASDVAGASLERMMPWRVYHDAGLKPSARVDVALNIQTAGRSMAVRPVYRGHDDGDVHPASSSAGVVPFGVETEVVNNTTNNMLRQGEWGEIPAGYTIRDMIGLSCGTFITGGVVPNGSGWIRLRWVG